MKVKNDYNLNENTVEVYQIKIKQAEYEDRIVRVIKALLEIDQLSHQQQDTCDFQVKREAA